MDNLLTQLNILAQDLVNCCRCCLKILQAGQKTVKISNAIKRRYFLFTQIELIESSCFSQIVCESCNSRLSEFCDFRNELREYQTKLYELCSVEQELNSEEYVEQPIKHEDAEQIETIIENEFIEEIEDEVDTRIEENEVLIEYDEEMGKDDIEMENDDEEMEKDDEDMEKDETVSDSIEEYIFSDIDDDSKYKLHNIITTEDTQQLKNPKMKTCTICNIELSASGFYHHIMRFHQNENRFSCDFCGKSFNLKNDLSMHMKKHLDRESRKKYPCSFCISLFLSRSALNNHIKLFHSQIVEIHPCEYCEKSFPTRMKYLQHRKSVHSDTVGEYLCQICERQYSSSNTLKKHMENSHGPKIPCPKCDKLIKPLSLTRHLQSHGGKRYKCPYEGCERLYQLNTSLKNHILAHHEMAEAVACECCGASFPTIRHLQRHIARQHKAVKFECEVAGCKSLFSRKDYLASHYQKHKDIDEETRSMLLSKVKDIKIISW